MQEQPPDGRIWCGRCKRRWNTHHDVTIGWIPVPLCDDEYATWQRGVDPFAESRQKLLEGRATLE